MTIKKHLWLPVAGTGRAEGDAPSADTPPPAGDAPPSAPSGRDGILDNGTTPPDDTTPPAGETPPPGDTPPAEPAKPEDAPHWSTVMPEEVREKFKDMSAEDAAKALERGIDYQPVESAESLKLDIPEDFPIAPQYVDNFKEFAVKAKLTPEQSQKIIEMYQGEELKAFNESVAENKLQLNEVFGDPSTSEYKDAMASAKRGIAYFDNVMGGRLQAAVNNHQNGLSHQAAFIEVMSQVGKGIREDQLPGSEPAGTEKELSSKEFYAQFHKD